MNLQPPLPVFLRDFFGSGFGVLPQRAEANFRNWIKQVFGGSLCHCPEDDILDISQYFTVGALVLLQCGDLIDQFVGHGYLIGAFFKEFE